MNSLYLDKNASSVILWHSRGHDHRFFFEMHFMRSEAEIRILRYSEIRLSLKKRFHEILGF